VCVCVCVCVCPPPVPEWAERPQQAEDPQDAQDPVPAGVGQRDQDVHQGHEDQQAVQHVPAGLQVRLLAEAEAQRHHLERHQSVRSEAGEAAKCDPRSPWWTEAGVFYLHGHLGQEDHGEHVVGHAQEHSLLEEEEQHHVRRKSKIQGPREIDYFKTNVQLKERKSEIISYVM